LSEEIIVAMSIGAKPLPIPRLEAGDCLDQATFHERYEAMPSDFRAELIGGMVIVPSPLSSEHAQYHALMMGWLTNYWGATPGVRAQDNATIILGDTSEPQPDGALVIDWEYGGQTALSDHGYTVGPPELIVEVASSSESIDLNAKRHGYEHAGVLEYVVLVIRQQVVRWFVLRQGVYQEVQADTDGIFKSTVFPGLWLHEDALCQLDVPRVMATLYQGLASPEHAAFVQQLQSRRETSR
jgi:Uma2 family endonuclease